MDRVALAAIMQQTGNRLCRFALPCQHTSWRDPVLDKAFEWDSLQESVLMVA
jgi:hypothetical protein